MQPIPLGPPSAKDWQLCVFRVTAYVSPLKSEQIRQSPLAEDPRTQTMPHHRGPKVLYRILVACGRIDAECDAWH